MHKIAHKHNVFTTFHLFHKPAKSATSVLFPSPPQLQQEASRSVCSGHSGQELKCSKEEPGASAPPLQERTALAAAAAAPPARSRGASERSSRCSEPSRASLARLLPKFARGPRRAGPSIEERSRRRYHCHRHRGLGVLRGDRPTEQRARISSESGLAPGGVAWAPQFPAPGAWGGEEARSSTAELFWRLSVPRGETIVPRNQQPWRGPAAIGFPQDALRSPPAPDYSDTSRDSGIGLGEAWERLGGRQPW